MKLIYLSHFWKTYFKIGILRDMIERNVIKLLLPYQHQKKQ